MILLFLKLEYTCQRSWAYTKAELDRKRILTCTRKKLHALLRWFLYFSTGHEYWKARAHAKPARRFTRTRNGRLVVQESAVVGMAIAN